MVRESIAPAQAIAGFAQVNKPKSSVGALRLIYQTSMLMFLSIEDHCHIHLIPRRAGDIDDPAAGGLRRVI